jgi:nicotinate-nucleotide pyrophosphorylase (carboxylating)
VYFSPTVRTLLQIALDEDIGRGDFTAEAMLDANQQAKATVLVKEEAVLAGLPVIEAVFRTYGSNAKITLLHQDGDAVAIGRNRVCLIEGNARDIVTVERTALNFLARLTGIATLTNHATRTIATMPTRLLDTRKTTPGWRMLEKYAVKIGGGFNHRYALDDMILIKDNHIALCGSVREAISRARRNTSISTRIEVEVDTLEQLQEALLTDVDMILLDNMSLEAMREAVALTRGKIPLEASGNMTIERLAQVAQTGVDYISMGALTHAARSLDVGLDILFE